MRFSSLVPWLILGLLVLLAFRQQKTEGFEGGLDKPFSSSTLVPEEELILHVSEGRVYWQEALFNGVAVSRHPTGSLATRKEYHAGKKHGKSQFWFANGQLSYQADYQDGKRHGVILSWWKNGNLRSQANYVQGVAHGVQEQWYQSGARFKRQNLVDGKEEGLQQTWRENGKLYNNYEAKNGRIFGLKRAKLCYELDDQEVQRANPN